MEFSFPKRLNLARVPTQIEELARFSRFLEGPKIYIKRDDQTGLSLSGNKVRKLEFLLADALAQGCDIVITCGGIQSNHARATAVAAAKNGLRCHLVLRSGNTTPADGNLFIDRLMGAEIEFLSEEDYPAVEQRMRTVAEEFAESGHKAYVIPEGGSNEIGSLGYVNAALEINEQLRAQNLSIDHIIVPVGSGGTLAGLIVGQALCNLPGQVWGINVCETPDFFERKIARITRGLAKKLEAQVELSRSDIEIIPGYIGKGYALSSQQELDVIKQVAKTEGILLDPVYTGKAMFGITSEIRKGRFKETDKILFIHTGGIFGLFPKKHLFF